MAEVELPKDLGLLSVMIIGADMFVLPEVTAQPTGPIVELSFITAMVNALAIRERGNAMPKDCGARNYRCT